MPKVLHIEDDPANRLLVRKLLSPAGFDVVDAADGVEGVRMALAERPDLVLVDISIPGLDGYEVTLRLRAEPTLRGVPIVAITAEGNRDASLAVGCDGYLQKPIDARSFADTVRGYLQGKRESASPDATGQHLRLQSQRIVSHLEEKIAQLSSANRRLVEADQAVFDLVSQAIAAAQELGELPAGNPARMGLVSWSMLHGVASLVVDGQMERAGVRDDAIEDFARRVARTANAGMKQWPVIK